MKLQLGRTYRLNNGEWVIYFGRSWPAWWKSDWAFLDPEKGTEVGSVNTRKMIKRYNPSRNALCADLRALQPAKQYVDRYG